MSLDASLDVDVGPDVTFAFAVVNGGTDPVELTFRSGKRVDLTVHEAVRVGDPIWRWSDGRAFTMAVESVELGPGERVDQEFVWSDPPEGEYVAVGTLEGDSEVEAAVEFEVE